MQKWYDIARGILYEGAAIGKENLFGCRIGKSIEKL
jgi:hypothetical protein